jgi:hypothetical protein
MNIDLMHYALNGDKNLYVALGGEKPLGRRRDRMRAAIRLVEAIEATGIRLGTC